MDAGGDFDSARRIDTRRVEPLFELRQVDGRPEPGDGARLAVRNLVRGYLLRKPTLGAQRGRFELPDLLRLAGVLS